MRQGVSVCLPVYNGATTIRAAIDSVLAQTYPEIELLVWDDGSSDGSYEIAREYEVRAFQAPNGGVARARNRMLEEAKFDLVAMIDHDDVWTPDKIERQLGHFTDHSVVLAHSNCRYVFPDHTEDPRTLSELPLDDPFAHILPDNRIVTSSVIFRKQTLIEAGGFQELTRCSDWQGWFELARGGKFVYDPEVMVTYFVRGNSLANAGYKFHEAQFKVLEDFVLKKEDHLFADLTPAKRKRYVDLAWRSSGVALSSMSSCEWHAGHFAEARKLGVQGLKRAPGVLRAWTRAFRAMGAAPTRPR